MDLLECGMRVAERHRLPCRTTNHVHSTGRDSRLVVNVATSEGRRVLDFGWKNHWDAFGLAFFATACFLAGAFALRATLASAFFIRAAS